MGWGWGSEGPMLTGIWTGLEMSRPKCVCAKTSVIFHQRPVSIGRAPFLASINHMVSWVQMPTGMPLQGRYNILYLDRPCESDQQPSMTRAMQGDAWPRSASARFENVLILGQIDTISCQPERVACLTRSGLGAGAAPPSMPASPRYSVPPILHIIA